MHKRSSYRKKKAIMSLIRRFNDKKKYLAWFLTKAGWTTQKFYASSFSIMNQTLKEMNREQCEY